MSDNGAPSTSFPRGLMRAFGGGILFATPLLMTHEMWELGATAPPIRLAVFVVSMAPLFVALDHISGFRRNDTWAEDVLDGLVGYGVGIVAALAGLLLVGVLPSGAGPLQAAGQVLLLAVPAAYGAVLANSQFAAVEGDEAEEREPTAAREPYLRELFLMVAGAMFFALQLGPTREMSRIAGVLTPWHQLVMVGTSIALVHVFVYRVNFRGQHEATAPGWQLLLRYSVVGYVLAAVTSAYVLWTFGHLDGRALGSAVAVTVVLSFPASLGAAAARLLV